MCLSFLTGDKEYSQLLFMIQGSKRHVFTDSGNFYSQTDYGINREDKRQISVVARWRCLRRRLPHEPGLL